MRGKVRGRQQKGRQLSETAGGAGLSEAGLSAHTHRAGGRRLRTFDAQAAERERLRNSSGRQIGHLGVTNGVVSGEACGVVVREGVPGGERLLICRSLSSQSARRWLAMALSTAPSACLVPPGVACRRITVNACWSMRRQSSPVLVATVGDQLPDSQPHAQLQKVCLQKSDVLSTQIWTEGENHFCGRRPRTVFIKGQW